VVQVLVDAAQWGMQNGVVTTKAKAARLRVAFFCAEVGSAITVEIRRLHSEPRSMSVIAIPHQLAMAGIGR
jgi:hypothetical protein